jgi:hypothetical protein
MDAAFIGTMGTTVKITMCFHTVTDYAAATMRTDRCQRMNGTFKTIEHMDLTILVNLKTFIILVTADFTNIICCARP